MKSILEKIKKYYGSSINVLYIDEDPKQVKEWLEDTLSYGNYNVKTFNIYTEGNGKHILEEINNKIDKDKINIVIGNGVGGYAAMLLKNVKKILVNPKYDDIFEDYKGKEFDGVDAEERSCTIGFFIASNKYYTQFKEKYNDVELIDSSEITQKMIKDDIAPAFGSLMNSTEKKIAYKGLKQFTENYEFITEHYVNAIKKNPDGIKIMQKYAKEVWDILEKSYAYCGGMAGMRDVQQLIDDSDMWKMTRRGGKINSVICYSGKRGGRKMCYLGSDRTEQGGKDLKKMWEEDGKMKDRQSCGEFSGKAVSTGLKQGMFPIPANFAKQIMHDKRFLDYKEDGYFYTRLIGGNPHTKIMMGNFGGNEVEPDENLITKLKALARQYDAEDEKINNG